jgi:hypothetical protein
VVAIGIPSFFFSGAAGGYCDARHKGGNDAPIMSKRVTVPDPPVIMVTGRNQADP